MLDALGALVTGLVMGLVNIGWLIVNPQAWLDWSDRAAMGRFIYYGGSSEFFFSIAALLIVLTVVGLIWKRVMWGIVIGLEGMANGLGRVFCWAGLIMVIQQIVIVFLQRIFRVSTIEFGPFAPFGYNLVPGTQIFGFDLQWWAEGLKLYNALVIVMCVAYTFVQGGHVRVDLFYARLSYHGKRVIDALGSVLFMMPMAGLIWVYAWFFMWRHLVTPNVSASERLEQVLRKANVMRWNIETIGPSPGGFNAYFLFKILIVVFALLVFLQAVAVLFRAIAEWREGPESEGKYLSRDVLDADAVKSH